MGLRDISLGICTAIIITLAWWCSHFFAPNMALAILPSMATTTCLWLSAPYVKTWRVLVSHALAAGVAAVTWFYMADITLSLLITVSIVAIMTTGWLRHAPAVATAAACAMHPDKLPQLGIALVIQLSIIVACVHVVQRIDK